MKFTPEHEALRQTWKTLIDREINPHVDQWEKDGQFPAHELFKNCLLYTSPSPRD